MTAEWRHVTDHFQTFIGNLQPTPLERRRAQTAAAEVALCLRRHFALAGIADPALSGGRPTWPTDDYLVTGGYGKGTAIRPARCVDMLYILPTRLRPPAAGRAPAASAASEVAAVLAETFAMREGPDEGRLAVRSFADFEIGLTPCFRTAGDALVVASARQAGSWVTTHPAAEAARLRQADLASGGKAVHLIMMLKAWRRARGVALGSLAIELLVSEFVLTWIYPRRSLLFYDWMVRDFFFWLVHQARRDLLTPGALEPLYLGDAWLEAAARAYGRARRACDMERDNRKDEAGAEWRAIFGPEFAAPTLTLPAGQGGVAALPGSSVGEP